MSEPLGSSALDRLFRHARTRNDWVEETLPERTWRDLYDLVKFGPTSANISPARFVFVTTPEGKARLAPLLSDNNQKALPAPAIVIVGQDLAFTDRMAELFPHNPDARNWFGEIDSAARKDAAFRNSSLQGAYLILAARALGLDCGPMSGFDNAKVDAAFFADTRIKSNFICSIGHGTEHNLFPRSPRHDFDDACKIL